jgi:hypothetical protein
MFRFQSPVPQFWDLDGDALDSGKVYIGLPNQNPEVSPTTVYWDEAGTIPAAQPLDTAGGYIVRNGTAALIYTSIGIYSITVRNRHDQLVYSLPSLTDSQALLSASTGSSLVGYIEGQTGSVAQTVQARLRHYVSVKDFGAVGDGATDDTSAINTAITAAVSGSKALWFPDGTYVTSSSLSSFHAILKFGPGYISRGGVSFAITPKATDTNIINVATTGNDLNDGLGTSQSFLTLQAALNALATYGTVLQGQWKINMAAGRYNAGATVPFNLRGVNYLQINGVSGALPFIPTTIIGAAVPTAGFGLNMNGNNNVLVQNIFFDNWSGGTASYGVVCQDICELYLNNCYFNLCDNAIKAQQSRLYVQGGVIGGGVVGITSISNNTHTIGYNATVAGTTGGVGMGTYITGCTQAGILVQENSTGHADFCTINNSVIGANVLANSRIHANGSVFTNNVTAGVITSGASWWLNSSSVFTSNGINWVQYATTQEIGNYGTAVAEMRSAYSNTTVNLTGTLVQTTMTASLGLGVLDRTLIWTGKSFRIRVLGNITGNAGTKTLRLYIGANLIIGTVNPTTSAGSYQWEVRVNGVDAGNQRVSSVLLNGAATTPVLTNVTSTAFSMATGSAQTVSVTGQLGNIADTLTINEVEMWETA